MKRWLVSFARLVFGLGTLAVTATGKAPPDWLTPALADHVAEWRQDFSAVKVLDFSRVQYLTEDRVKRLYRVAIRVVEENGRSRAEVVYGYNTNTEKIVSAQAWVVTPDGKNCEAFGASSFADVGVQEA